MPKRFLTPEERQTLHEEDERIQLALKSGIHLDVRLREAREKWEMTQEYASAVLGVRQQNLSNWESGAASPNLQNLKLLAVLYCTSADELLDIPPELLNNDLFSDDSDSSAIDLDHAVMTLKRFPRELQKKICELIETIDVTRRPAKKPRSDKKLK